MNAPITGLDSGARQEIVRGLLLLQQGQLDAASALADRLVAAWPNDAAALIFASEVRLASGDTVDALAFTEAAIKAAPDQTPLLLKKAKLLMFLRRRSDARATAEIVANKVGDDPHALWAVARFYHQSSESAAALHYFKRVLAALGAAPDLLYDIASCQFFTGEFAAAEATLDRLLASAPRSGHGHYLRATLREQTSTHNHLDELRAAVRGEFPNPAEKAACLYALAKECEDLGQHEESIAALMEGAALKRSTLSFDLDGELANISAIAGTFNKDFMATPDVGHQGEGAIFIVGMPRTGTTLVESILSRHPDVGAAGELMDFGMVLGAACKQVALANEGMMQMQAATRIDYSALGLDYLERAREAAPGHRLFIDKMPVNYLYCGAIHKALPKARIIHLMRDPMDSCYAAFKTLFAQAYFFSYDLHELARYYASYQAVMKHWHEVMPSAILDVRYEDMVSDPETQSRRIFEWCGLEWQPALLTPSEDDEPAATASAAQVRQPIHARSVRKWRHYQRQLAPLQAELVALGVNVSD